MPFSSEAVAGLSEMLRSHVETTSVPGAVALVANGGDVHVEVAGVKAVGDTEPLGRDSIFRIASLTKPITGAAAMILVEEGALDLGSSVEDLLPELANRRVLRSLESEIDDTVPAERPITVEDLLTFRLGFGSVMAPAGTYPIQRAEAELELGTLGPPWPPPPHSPDKWIAAFGTLPLIYQPGERWLYNTGAQVLGVLIERAAGQPFEAFLWERIFEPLGMRDTGFHVPDSKQDRFTTSYLDDLSLLDAPAGWWSRPPVMANGAAWLTSTIDDYWAFVRMLIAGGDGVLSQSSVDLLTRNHISASQRAAAPPFLDATTGWGYCMSAPVGEEAGGKFPHGFGWDGGLGTTWRTDVPTGTTGILFTNRAMDSPEPPAIFRDFWVSARRFVS